MLEVETVEAEVEVETVEAEGAWLWGAEPIEVDAFTLTEEEWYTALQLRPAPSTVTDSLGAFFMSLLPDDARILGVYWMFEGEVLRVWTVIDDVDFDLESPIYDAQVRFLETMPEIESDFFGAL